MISVALPEIIIFTVVAAVSYIQLKFVFEDSSIEKVASLRAELMSIIRFQDVSLAQASRNLEHNAQGKMKALRYDYFATSDSIETADLERIRREIGMNETDDIYIINSDGIIVNTTMITDQDFNLFSIGGEFEEFLRTLFYHDFYSPQPMSLETNTRKFKKFIYQSSRDHRYIIQLGFYSTEAGRFNTEVARRLREIESGPGEINSIDLILAPWNPFSLYKGKDIEEGEVPKLREIFENKSDEVVEQSDTKTSYIFFENTGNETISWQGILKVVYDKTKDREILFESLIQKISFFGVGMVLLLIILFINVKLIIRPIDNLSAAALDLGRGKLSKRAEAGGTREMIFLAETFNSMADNLEKSHLEISKKNEEILSSINYARRLQEAILPPQDLLAESLGDHFVLYLPKDVVAGDFYWMEKNERDVFIAAADCTGHGVPGAMVSMVCSGALNRAIKEMKLREPAEILNQTRDLVIETFEKSHYDVLDGMDIALIRFDRIERKVAFAGAQNPLYRVTSSSPKSDPDLAMSADDADLLEYKGHKQPIGKFVRMTQFSQQEIECLPGDCLYLFTDGYADQFGGPDGKKFMYKNLKKLLLTLHSCDMNEQKEKLTKAFNDWRADGLQIDDICIIGIRL